MLAINGGKKNIETPLTPYNSMGAEESKAAAAVVESGVLSKFLGSWHEDFFGGPRVREFEQAAAEYFGVKHAITVNSWTSGLIAAVGAIGIQPGDEVIVTPWSMSATATAILHWCAIPVFADIDESTYNLSPTAIEAVITPHTRAIVVADIFGQSADMFEIMLLAKRYGLKVISDTAQAPGSLYRGAYSGTLADIGGFSLNYHKHIHTGEGGILVTDNDFLADRLRLIRNHGEVVASERGDSDFTNLVGYNFRLGEIESAIGLVQLKKLESIVKSRQRAAELLTSGLKGLPGLSTPVTKEDRTHAFYVYAAQIDSRVTGVSRDKIAQALKAEGLNVSNRYANLHLLPTYQLKQAYGSNGFPWTSEICKRVVDYSKGICPVAENLNDERYLGLGLCNYSLEDNDVNLILETFYKVFENLAELK